MPKILLGKRCMFKVILYNWCCGLQLVPHLGPFLSPESSLWEMTFVGPSTGSGEACSCKSPLCHAGKMTQISPRIFLRKISNSTLFVLQVLLGSQVGIWHFGLHSQGAPGLPTGLWEQWGREVSSQLPHPHHSHHSEEWMCSPPTRGNWPLELLAALV